MDLEKISKEILSSTRKIVVSSSKLPSAGTDYSLNLSVPAIRTQLSEKRNGVIDLIDQMFNFLNVKVPVTSLRDNQWQDDADVEDFMDCLVDANDHVFEHIGDALDSAAGLKKEGPELVIVNAPRHKFRKPAANSLPLAKQSTPEKSNGQQDTTYKLFAAKIVERPQLKFPDKIDNSNSVFIPKLQTKPNALRSLADSMIRLDDGDGSYQNPYSYELESFVVSDDFVKPSNYEEAPGSLEDTPLSIVSTPEEFSAMMKDLEIVSEIAVDLEHHSYRTFLGFTCLLQISTRIKDYIIDTLSLRGQIQELLPIFTNPNVLKVFHGAEMDINWLQRDFGIYVVNMFDTYVAAKTLGFPRLSLAYLLDRYVHVDVDKKFQLADWRIRPLPEELIKYARSDTHYLLHVCDLMKKSLIDKASLDDTIDSFCLARRVFDESSTVCSLHYEKPLFTENSYLELYERSRKVFNSQQMTALKLLSAWRDKIARREDESTGYVLPNHMLLQIVELLPKEPTGILACCQPIPPIVKQQSHEMHGLIIQARRQPLQQFDNPAVVAAKTHFVSTQKNSPELEALSCPLDKSAKFPENIDVLQVEIVQSPRKKVVKHQFSSFLNVLLPTTGRKVQKPPVLSGKIVLLNKTVQLLKGYALKTDDFPHAEKKPALVSFSQLEGHEATVEPRSTPVKRQIGSQEEFMQLEDKGASSSSPPKRGRRSTRKQNDEEIEPLVVAKVPTKKRKRGPKFVENPVIVISEEEEESPAKSTRKRTPATSDRVLRRRDYHEKNARQMQTFSTPRKRPSRRGK